MPQKTKGQGAAKSRTKVKNLPAKEKKLTKNEQKDVKGGLIGLLINDPSKQVLNSQITDGTSNAASNAALLPAVKKP